MKKITFLPILVLTLLTFCTGYAQKVVIIGMNHVSNGPANDGFTFVATENIPAGEVIYFTDIEYASGSNNFPTYPGEAVIKYTVGAGGLNKGIVVYMREISSNTFSIACTSGNCGSYTFSSGSLNLATNGDGLYAYSDTDDNPGNGITQIYSVMFTGSGETSQNGGNIPTAENPITNFPNAIVVDGFTDDVDGFNGPDKVEFKFSPTTLRDGVSQTALENPANYLEYTTNADLSVVEFTNLNLAGANPVLTVTASPTSVNENSGTGIVYTFTLDTPAAGNIVANFSVEGTATYSSDYAVTGATTFSASTGTVTIADGTSSKIVTITPNGDTTLEPDETITLTITPGTGYDGGSPSAATVTILNDDTQAVTPMVAITGTNNDTVEGFSFVALDDIPANTTIYFTDQSFNNSTLQFEDSSEGVYTWTSPGSVVPRGEVIVATESSANTLTTTCDSGNCGAVAVTSGVFSLATEGESFYAYSDSDADPTNGITEIYAVLHTGDNVTGGGNIPAINNPTSVYPGSVLVDGFPATSPNRTEYKFAGSERDIDVDQANFQNTTNWLYGQANQTLSDVPFNNIIISSGSANPIATVNISPSSVAEDSGTGMVYTFSLSSPATSDVDINFTVTGTATLTSDYTQTGATAYTSTTGTVTIANGSSSATVTLTPVVDTTVEPIETITLALASGIGYNGGSPNDATGSITNDDTSNSDPLVAITGMSHLTTDGFSFVAIEDIPANTVIYFTEDEFDNSTLLFSSGEALIQWTSPATGIISKGDVIVITETGTDTFTLSCSNTSSNGCGTLVVLNGNSNLSTTGDTLYAYQDNDTDPTNGVTDIYAVMYTGGSGIPGGNIPASQDPSGIYLSALVVDGFPATNPARTEYDETKRNVPVDNADFVNITNWVHGETPAALSTTPFTDLAIGNQPPTAVCQDITLPLDAMGNATLTPSLLDNGSTDDGGTVFLAFETMSFNGETTSASPQDEYFPDSERIYYYNQTAFTVPVTGNYTFGMSGTSSDTSGLVLVIFNDTPVPNSGELLSRPEYLTFSSYEDTGANIAGTPTIALDAGTTYYMHTAAVITLETASFTVTVDQPIRTTAASETYNCTHNGLMVPKTLYTFDPQGNTSSCMSTATVFDTIKPVITCPADQTQDSALYTVPDYFGTGEATATDNCTSPVTNTTQSPAAGTTLTPGVYTVTLTAKDASGNTSTCDFELTVNDTLGLDENQLGLASVTMYPNPVKNEVYLSNPKSLNLQEAKLYDMRGRLIQVLDLKGMGTSHSFNVTKLASATYIMIIKSDEGQITKRLLKE